MLPNIPAMVEAHFGVPMLGAVLNTLNTRLDTPSVLFMLGHGEARALIIDTEYAELAQRARAEFPHLAVISVHDLDGAPAALPGATDYEAFLAAAPATFDWQPPADEWDAIALNYTSGTTGDPKGVVYHYRGAYLNAVSNILEWDMPKHPAYLWTLPLFHCNGWCFAWTVAARAGVNVCLRKFDPKTVFDLIRAEGVTHCGAPIVQSALANAPAELRAGITHTVRTMVAGAAPAPAVIAKMKEIGFELTHVYGLTEVYGPAAVCARQASWDALEDEERALLNARQGVRYHLQAGVSVRDPETMLEVPADEQTVGEIMFRGNICMKGYLKNERATEDAFAGGWFHTGDLGVMTPDGYIRIRTAARTSSSPAARTSPASRSRTRSTATPRWPPWPWSRCPIPRGETPCAFVELKPGCSATAEEIIAHCKLLLPGFKVPRAVRFGELPKTSTGKIQKFELRAAVGATSAIDLSGPAADPSKSA